VKVEVGHRGSVRKSSPKESEDKENSGVVSPLVQFHRTKVGNLELFKRKRIGDLNFLKKEVFKNGQKPEGIIVHRDIGFGKHKYRMHDEITSRDFST
jgi:hypothetical protein